MSLRIPGAGGDSGAAPSMTDQSHGGGALGVSMEESISLEGGKFSSKHSGLLVLVMVMAVAGAALWGMRQMGMGNNVSIAGDVIDYLPDGLDSASSSAQDEVIKQLQNSGGSFSQIPLEDVDNNPFKWNMIEAAPIDSGPVNTVDEAELARRERIRHIESEFSTLRLVSVMGGSVPVARVSGKLVREGDAIGQFFTVEDIGTRQVVLVADGKQFTLTMEE